MFRATTPTHIFNLPFSANLVKTIRITYQQRGKTVLEKTEADCTTAENAIKVKLTQEETLQFSPDTWVRVQLRVVTTGGQVLASEKYSLTVEACMNEEVLPCSST